MSSTRFETDFSTPNYYLGSPNNSLNLVLATVPGEGIHLYETSQYQHLNSWLVPNDVTILGPAQLSIVCGESSALSPKKAKNKLLASIVGSESESGVESELSSTIDTQNFQLLDGGYYLYALISKKDVCKSAWVWTLNGKKNEIKFEEPVLSLQPLEFGTPSGGACVVVFKSGKIGLYSADLTSQLSTSICPRPVFWAEVLHGKHMPYLESSVISESQHCVIVASHDKNKLIVQAFKISPESNEISEAGIPVVLKSMPNPKDAAVSFWPQTGALFYLSSDYALYRTQLLFGGKQEDPKKLALRKLDSAATIAALSSDHVALLAADKEGENPQYKLFLWDTKLCALLYQQTVGELVPPSKSQCVAHLDKTHDQLIVSVMTQGSEAKTEILLFPYHCPAKSSLLDSLNKMASTVPYLASDEGTKFQAPPSALPLAVTDGSVNAISGLHALDEQLCKELQLASSVEDVFFAHLSKLEGVHSSVIVHRTLFPKSGLFSSLKARASTSEATDWTLVRQQAEYDVLVPSNLVALISGLSPRYISILVDRLATNYSSKVMSALLISSRVTSSMFRQTHGGLLPWLIQSDDWANVQLALAVVLDISEEELVELLKSLHAGIEKKGPEAQASLEALLGLVLDYSFDRQLLLYSLTRLSGEAVSFYLTVLSRLLEEFSCPQSLLSKHSAHFDKIYRLLSSIVDVHFTYIASSEDLHGLLLQLRKTTRSRMEVLHAFSQIEPLLEPFTRGKRSRSSANKRSKRSRPHSRANSSYTIEVFNLF
ncbi:hypothetical protein DSO57_1028691 [Entomophthora muscae]|uniref:Uncharacterized protein n=1 Tax=Entomophthora muscae TaxID=34485 RepID=A0ACC2SEH4_9FUNG|nr:hypothetical protein DSO57_1028691 [Entomophthora muscae]